ARASSGASGQRGIRYSRWAGILRQRLAMADSVTTTYTIVTRTPGNVTTSARFEAAVRTMMGTPRTSVATTGTLDFECTLPSHRLIGCGQALSRPEEYKIRANAMMPAITALNTDRTTITPITSFTVLLDSAVTK